MANVCSYTLKVVGKYQDVCNFYTCLIGVEDYEENQMSTRFYDAECYRVEEQGSNTAFYILGSCAWSVQSSFIDYCESGEISVLSFSKKHHLSLEFYSEECGMEFAEHYIIRNGLITTKEVVKYREVSIEDIEEDPETFFNDEFVKENGITKENYLEKFDGEDWLYLGGFVGVDFTI